MQVNGRVRTPPLSHFAPTNQPHYFYSSSSEDSYGGLQSHSRSASGTSQTNYDDPIATPPPRVLMEEYTQLTTPNDTPQRRSSGFQKSQKLPPVIPDQMTMHLLLETAIDDCENFEVLTPEELRDLKKEQKQLARRIESAKRRLFIESRVNNTAHSLQRLEPKTHTRKRSSDEANGLDVPEATRAPVSKKCEELANTVWRLERRQTELQDRCMRHTAAVLQLNYQLQMQDKQDKTFQQGSAAFDSDDEAGTRQLDFNEDVGDLADAPRNLKPRLQALSGELYGLISQSGPYSKAGYTKPPDDIAGSDDDLTYIEMGLSIIKGLHQELVRYSNDSVEKVRRQEQTNVVLSSLWDVVASSEQDLRRHKQAMRNLDGTFRGLEDDSSDEDEAEVGGEDEAVVDPRQQFPLQSFSDRVERICSRAATLSERHVAVQQQLSQERELNGAANANITAQIELKAAEIESIHDQMKKQQTTISEKADLIHQLEDERQDMEAEIMRLRRGDGAASDARSRAIHPDTQQEMDELIRKNTDLMSGKDELDERVDMLQRELKELVAEYEGMVKQNVEAEKEREVLEAVVDNLKERIEVVETKLHDERIRTMGKAGKTNTDGEAPISTDSTSMGIMRAEFKKIMRDSRSEHFKSLKAEQEERRRLEAIIRNLRKEQGSVGKPVETKTVTAG